MPFGLANAPAHFQAIVHAKFHDILGLFVVVYLDDFLIFSQTEEEHVSHVREVLSRLRHARLFAKMSKCEFHTTTTVKDFALRFKNIAARLTLDPLFQCDWFRNNLKPEINKVLSGERIEDLDTLIERAVRIDEDL